MNRPNPSKLPLSLGTPQQLVGQLKRTLDGAAGAVGAALPAQLEWVMRTPLRRVVLEAVFWQMPRFFDQDRAGNVDTTVRWHITGEPDTPAEVYDLVFRDGSCRAVRGGNGEPPRLAITIDRIEFLRLITGNSDPVRAYFNRRLALSGDIMFAAKMVSLFRVPRLRPSGLG